MGVFELLSASPAVKASIRFRSSSAQIMHEAADAGMGTLVQDGIEKILRGQLDLAQVRQALP
jgi:type II secretory ATPase GspE/PulE/Tfp pilus assembly ATPase PilB-like protein